MKHQAARAPRVGEFQMLQLIRVWLRARGRLTTVDHSVRFKADLSGAFPGKVATAVQIVDGDAAEAPCPATLDKLVSPSSTRLEITTPDYCVASQLGPLPEPYLEWVRDLSNAGAPAMQDFLDAFNQRIQVLRYSMRATLDFSLNNSPPENTLLATALGALMGIGEANSMAQVPLSPRRLLGVAQNLANQRRSPAALTRVLSAALQIPVHLQALQGQWRRIQDVDRCYLGRGSLLGTQTVLGRRVWDLQAAVALSMGPMSLDQAETMMPPLYLKTVADPRLRRASLIKVNSVFPALASLVRLLLDRSFDSVVRLHLERQNDLPRRLVGQVRAAQDLDPDLRGRFGFEAERGMRLGLTAFLGSMPGRTVVEFSIPAYDEVPA